MASLEEMRKKMEEKALSDGKSPEEIQAQSEKLTQLYNSMDVFKHIASGNAPPAGMDVNAEFSKLMEISDSFSGELPEDVKNGLKEASDGISALINNPDKKVRDLLNPENMEKAKDYVGKNNENGQVEDKKGLKNSGPLIDRLSSLCNNGQGMKKEADEKSVVSGKEKSAPPSQKTEEKKQI